jgi:hypothetical protein
LGSLSSFFAPVLLVGCAEAPQGIQTADGSKVLWSPPDTVALPVSGEPASGEPTAQDADWRSPDSVQEARTKELWLERLRTLRGLIGREHIPEVREAVVRELAIGAAGSQRGSVFHDGVGGLL